MTKDVKYSVGPGGPVCPDKFVVRCNGALVREGARPLVFDTQREAQDFIDMTTKEEAA